VPQKDNDMLVSAGVISKLKSYIHETLTLMEYDMCRLAKGARLVDISLNI